MQPITPEPPHAAPLGHAHASERTARYVARLDAHLAALPSKAARLACLTAELAKWTHLYECFRVSVAADYKPGPKGPDAFDFILTICEISTRKERAAA